MTGLTGSGISGLPLKVEGDGDLVYTAPDGTSQVLAMDMHVGVKLI